MSAHCNIRDGIVSTGASAGINSLVEKSLELIKKYLFPNAHRVNPSLEIELTLTKPRFWKYVLTVDEIAFIVDRIDLQKIVRSNVDIRGCYVSENGKIFLNKESWCISTVIHETLHSCSLTSLIPDLMKYRPLYEGLTEFYTGYILYKEYHDTFENCWKTELGTNCQLTYEQSTKIWSAFCNFIPISETIGIYFHDDSLDWKGLFDKFVKKIRIQYKDFKNPLEVKGPAAHLNLHAQCASNFGFEFSKICASRSRFTDFSKIKSCS